MGIQSGAVSISRYKVLGSRKHFDLAELNRLVEPHKAGSIELKGPAVADRAAWDCPPGPHKRLEEVDLWDMADGQIEDGLLLRMRLERRKVPPTLLQLMLKEKIRDLAAKRGKTPGRKERTDIKDELQRKLLKQALPALVYVDAFWRDRAGDLWLFNTSKAIAQHFETLFNTTFAEELGLALVPVTPPLGALDDPQWRSADAAEKTVARLAAAVPLAFTEQQIYP